MLDRKIELVDPGPPVQSETGQVSHPNKVVHRIWAHTQDYFGGEEMEDGTVASTIIRTFQVRDSSVLAGLTERWYIREGDETFNIRAIKRGNRIDRQLVIRTERGT